MSRLINESNSVNDIDNIRMGRQASKTIIPQGWTIDIRSTTFAIITLAIVAALFAADP